MSQIKSFVRRFVLVVAHLIVDQFLDKWLVLRFWFPHPDCVFVH